MKPVSYFLLLQIPTSSCACLQHFFSMSGLLIYDLQFIENRNPRRLLVSAVQSSVAFRLTLPWSEGESPCEPRKTEMNASSSGSLLSLRGLSPVPLFSGSDLNEFKSCGFVCVVPNSFCSRSCWVFLECMLAASYCAIKRDIIRVSRNIVGRGLCRG